LLHAAECAGAAYVYLLSAAPWIYSEDISDDSRQVLAYRRLYVFTLIWFVDCNVQFLAAVALVHFPSLTSLRNVSISVLADSAPVQLHNRIVKILRIPSALFRLSFMTVLVIDAHHLKNVATLNPIRAYAIYQCVFGLCVVAATILFLCGLKCFLLVAFACCETWARDRIERLFALLDPRPNSITSEQVEAVAPAFQLVTPLPEETDCIVCLDSLVEEQSLRKLPACGHLFHAECIDRWFQVKTNCPTCRAEFFSGSLLASP
jgi:hypothetical protein